MKCIPSLVLLYVIPLCSTAQTSGTFDVASYQIPAGWQQNQNTADAVSYAITNNQKGTYAQIILYQSTPGKGTVVEDFKAEWKALVADAYKVSAEPQMEQEKTSNGWKILAGSAPFEFSGTTSLVMLVTVSDTRTCMAIVMMTNSDDYQPALESFISSLSFRPGSYPVVQTQRESVIPDGKPETINGTWIRPGSVRSYIDDYKNPYSANSQGYQKDQYTFYSNGTYTYYSKTFKSVYDKLLLVRENGVYQLEGTSLTVTPQKSVLEVYSKKDGTDKWGKLEKTDSRPLEKVTYECFFHYFSGIQQWNLVLRHNTETQRDGKFSGNTSYANAWYFSAVSSNNPVIDLP